MASPPAPPSWPPHQLFVDPGEGRWPTEWFGNYSTPPYDSVEPAPWNGTHGAICDGFDFGLPPGTQPSSTGMITLQRSYLQLPNPPNVAASLPTVSFRANTVLCMWVSWRNFEPTEGAYAIEALVANFEAATASGWHFALRMLTSRVEEAPIWLANLGLPTIDYGTNYDPAAPAFHARYLAMLEALRLSELCQRSGFVMAYAGYASTSWGDEYIGPHGPSDTGDPAEAYRHVRERLDGWARVCERQNSHKVLMGGESAYGRSLGFGTRNGFVEHYWYQVPDPLYGQIHSHGEVVDQYLRVDEDAPLLEEGRILGEENEEYEANWSSEWRTWSPAEFGGEYNASAPPQGHAARYGPLRSFPYRYLMSSLRLLQMRCNYLLASTVVVNPDLYSYVALALGREADDSPDAWAFLASAEFANGRGTVSNFERWLHQRDQPPTIPGGVQTFPDARLTQTPAFHFNDSWWTSTWMTAVPHDWIAHAAPRGVIGFEIAEAFAHSTASPLASQAAVVKVTFFDLFEGSLALTQAHKPPSDATVGDHGAPTAIPHEGQECWLECGQQAGACDRFCGSHAACCKRGFDGTSAECGHGAAGCTGNHCCSPLPTRPPFVVGEVVPTSGDQALKTATFVASPLEVRGASARQLFDYDFEIRAHDSAGAPQPLVLSMARVIKTAAALPSSTMAPSAAPIAAIAGSIVAVLLCGVAVLATYCKVRKHAKMRLGRIVDPTKRSSKSASPSASSRCSGMARQAPAIEAAGGGVYPSASAASVPALVVGWRDVELSDAHAVPAGPPPAPAKNPFFM